MELMTPQTLWKDFDTQAPFDETVLRYVDDNGHKIKEFYFSGLRTKDGTVRIFARYMNNGDDLPTIVYFGEADEPLNIPKLSRHNFLAVDYTGVKSDKIRGTMYPYTLDDADKGETVENLPPKNSRWYAWASVAMYAVLYAQRNCGNGKVAVIGVGQGGSLVWKLSACVAPDVGISLFSAYDDSRDDLYYRACLDNRAYAPILKFPVMEIVCSNEGDGSIDFMSEIFAAIKRTDCRLCINERSNHTLGEAGKRNVELWLEKYLYGEGEVPPTPTMRSYESGGKLYYEVRYNGTPDEIKLYMSTGNVHASMRNWSNVQMMKLEDSYLTPITVYDANAAVNAFVTVKEGGYKISSSILSRVPAKMGIVAENVKFNRLIYDGDMGVDDWTGEDNEQPEMSVGPFDIASVCANKPLITFKLADVRFRGMDGSLLQIMFYSDAKQKVEFTITDCYKNKFTCSVDADYRHGWVTANYAAEDFKTETVTLNAWKDVVTFEVTPQCGNVLIASLLWV